MDTNTVVLIGNLTRDPELAYTPSNNTALCKFAIANNGRKKDDVGFFDIVCFGKTAETCNQYLNKGNKVSITGRLEQSRYQDKSGQNRSSINIVANTVQFLTPKNNSGQGGYQKNNQSPPQANPDPFQENKSFENYDFDNPENEQIPF